MATRRKYPDALTPLLHHTSLYSGLVLFVYVCTHLVNHALGLISLEAMEDGREWFLAVWRNAIGTLILYGALVTHIGATLFSLYARRSLRMPIAERSAGIDLSSFPQRELTVRNRTGLLTVRTIEDARVLLELLRSNNT